MTLGKPRELANVTRGRDADSLARVGESLGFTTRGVQCTFQALLGFELPFIAHWEGYHYIIVYGLSKQHVWVADPGPGFANSPLPSSKRADGNLVCCSRLAAIW
jgi:ATP-binding cassette subfamily B protein